MNTLLEGKQTYTVSEVANLLILANKQLSKKAATQRVYRAKSKGIIEYCPCRGGCRQFHRTQVINYIAIELRLIRPVIRENRH